MYHIYTEDTNRAGIETILARHFDAYTLLSARGVWRGQAEDSLVIELDGVAREDVEQAAREIKAANSQQAVLVAEIAATTFLV